MKNLSLLAAIFCLVVFQALYSQNYVSTDPQDKNVILEEFTGVNCPNCPQGHQTANQILTDNPGRAWVVGFHPYNSNYTTPGAGEPDFRRHHPDSLYMIPYCGSSRFMPSAYINRRVYNGERIQSRTVWANYSNQILAEPSPVNTGLATTYNDETKQLEILVEIYYTGDMTDLNSLNVLLMESGMVAYQSGGSSNYVHNHVFRETFTAQWGDLVTEPTTQGSFIQKTFTFDNSAEEYDMEQCEVLAYIVNAATTEIITGIGCHVGENTNFSPPVADFSYEMDLYSYETMIDFTDLSSYAPTSWQWTFEGGTPALSSEQHPSGIMYTVPGDYTITLIATNEFGADTITQTIYVDVLSGIHANAAIDFGVYPNPSSGILFIDADNMAIERIDIYSSSGKLVYQMNEELRGTVNLDLSDIEKGIYFLHIKTRGNSTTKRIILSE